MNGILVKVGGEQLILLMLAFLAVLAVLADLGGAFWTIWLVLAAGCLAAVKWQQRRLVTGVD